VVWETVVGRHENDDLTVIPPGTAVKVFPGIYGGVETPMAERDGLLFVPVVNLGTLHTATGHGSADGSSALVKAAQNTNLREGTGELLALDAATGEVVWRQELPSPVFGGATVVGEIVFTATYDGIIYGFSRTTGDEVWRYDTGGRVNAWPAVEDGFIVWPVGLGPRPRLIAFAIVDSTAGLLTPVTR
jgi:outer membrane protein assembly factor BamB